MTQQFNTTTSMGRLTLNVLLSFAQFEREVTAERIRDKVAASKRKGLWVGGMPASNRTGKRTGNFAESDPPAVGFSAPLKSEFSGLRLNSLRKRTREFPYRYQGKFFKEQGKQGIEK